MKRKSIKILTGIAIALIAISCRHSIYAATNRDTVAAKGDYDIKDVSPTDDITSQLQSYIEDAKNQPASKPVLISIPSGTFTVGDTTKFVIPANTTIVAENNTIIKKTDDTNHSILRTNTNTSKNIVIYGGTWDGNNVAKHGFEFVGSTGVTIEKVTLKNCVQNGLYLNNKANITSINSTIDNNKKYGIAIYGESTLTLKGAKITNNKTHGICLEDSVLYANSTANTISTNNWAGISTNGSKSKLYLKNNKINKNGQKPKGTDDGEVGHGVAIHDGTIAEISNNEIANNKTCGISVYNNNKVKTIISSNTIHHNGRHGIGARNKTTLTVSSNDIYNNSYNGVLLSDNSSATLKNNKVSSNANLGISVVNNSSATLEGNTITKNTQSNVSGSGESSKITITKDNKISESKKSNGISISDTAELKITGNGNSSNNNAGSGITVSSKKGKVTITGKTTLKANKKSGLVVYGTAKEIKNITADGNTEFGVSVRSGGSLTITNSTIKNNKIYGITVVDSKTTAKIEKNNIYKNKKAGINVDKKAKVTSIYKNELNKNGDKAIRIAGKAKVEKIKKNTIKKHSKYGIYIKNGTAKTVKNNKFSGINKKKQVYKA